jgi:MFS-type transporter involved in bile tolerance (Atg22 family)
MPYPAFGLAVFGLIPCLGLAGASFFGASFVGILSNFSLSVTKSSVSILVLLTPGIISVYVLDRPALQIIT